MASGFYETLGVSHTATDADIKKAFKELAKKYHPDKHPGKSFYEEHFKKINEAYQVLSDRQRRAQYDFTQYHSRTTYTQQTSQRNQRPPYSAQQRPQASAYRRPSPQKKNNAQQERERKLRRYYLFTGLILVILCVSGYWFYNFMNDYTAGIYYKEGVLAEQKKEYQEAMQNYLMCLTYNDHNPAANEKAGDMYVQITGNYTKALTHYTRAYGFYPDVADKKRVGLKKAKALIQLNDSRAALKELSILERMTDHRLQTDDSITYYKADAYFIQEQYLEAQSLYEYFLRRHSKSSEALVKIALCQYNQGNKDFAFTTLKKAADRFPDRGESYYFKGQMYILESDTVNACIQFHRADSLHVAMATEATDIYCK